MTAAEQATVARLYTISELLALTGAKYRFVDYAIRAGHFGNDTAHGSGSRRLFTEAEVDTIYAVVSLLAVGFTVAGAFEVARSLVSDDHYRVHVGSIFVLDVSVRNTNPEETQP